MNLAADPAERKDVAADNAEKLTALLARWEEYATANNAIIPSRSVFESSEDTMPPRFPDDRLLVVIYMRQFVPSSALIVSAD